MATKLETLIELLKQAPDEVFLQPHNVPDPDAIASCLGLQHLLSARGIASQIVYDQEIEKANSLKMIELFKISMASLKDVATLGAEDWAVLVDAQKGGSNVSHMDTDEVAVIDHHEYQGNKGYRFEDIRPETGSCSAIIAEYFFENNIPVPRSIASALLYGIFMDTDNLTRRVDTLDINMFYKLYNLADLSHIIELKGNEISVKDLKLYADAFKTVEIYDELGFLHLTSSNDSLLGSAGDIVLSVDTVEIVVAYALRENGIKLSVRSARKDVKANELVRFLVEGYGLGGGHENMAGGFIPQAEFDSSKSIDTFLKHRAIAFYEKCLGHR
jgi:nanoRNase/pAp phosphatase (c-di-AMP/oligoRNAs hydrolase)